MLVRELLSESFLLEKLGNLAQLKVGPMIDILKQGKYSNRKYGSSSTPIGSRFGGGSRDDMYRNHTSFGDTSKIVDVGVIKGGIAGLRKAYKEHNSAQAFALYVDGKAVCFGVFDAHDLGGSSRTGIFTYDLTPFKAQFDKEYEEKKAQLIKDYGEKDTYWLRNHKPRDLTPYREEEPDSWDKKRAAKEGRVLKNKRYQGVTKDTGDLKEFIAELIKLADGKPITCKLVLANEEGMAKQRDRHNNHLSNNEILTGIEALKIRLTKYKISKKPTVDNIEDFIKATLNKNIKVVQFGGRGWKTTPESGDKLNPLHVLDGQPFEIDYRCVDPGDYDSLSIYYKFNKETGLLKPFKATWSEKPKDPAGFSRRQRVGVLDPDTYLKDELKIDKLDKDSILKAILLCMKNNHLEKARDLVTAVEKHGLKYPELEAIKKSLGKEKDED